MLQHLHLVVQLCSKFLVLIRELSDTVLGDPVIPTMLDVRVTVLFLNGAAEFHFVVCVNNKRQTESVIHKVYCVEDKVQLG